MCEFSHLCNSESQATMTPRFTVCLMTRPRCVLLHCNCSKVKLEPKLIVSCVEEQKYALTVNSPSSCAPVRQLFEAQRIGADSAVSSHVVEVWISSWHSHGVKSHQRFKYVTNLADQSMEGAKKSCGIYRDTSSVLQLIRPSSFPNSTGLVHPVSTYSHPPIIQACSPRWPTTLQ